MKGCRGNGILISIPIPFPQDFCGNTHKKTQKNPQNPHMGIPIGLKSFPFPSHMGILPIGKPTDPHSQGNPGNMEQFQISFRNT